ncbi:MAG: DUF1844 domain-containing protein [bacterium]|nr:DUF1844 domain-containing protein [bacterium]
MNEDKNKQLFLSLIYTFQMQTMMQLGKLPNPVTNKTEIEIEGAQVSIDMLDMLKEKTMNNLADDEKRFLEQTVADLKLNFVDESSKPKKESPEKSGIEEDQHNQDNPIPPQE